MGKTCAICGKPSGMYPLCKDCFKLKDEEKVVKCEECGTWYLADEGCPNCKPVTKKESDPAKDSTKDELACIICGKPSNGKHFCLNCYRKYRNKYVVVKIYNCSETELLEDGYESKITCEDGHPVKSQQEAMIDDYLFRHNIKHTYEKPFPIDGNQEHDLHPDFYLPDLNIYIEHFGVEGSKKYEETKEYKLPIYEKAGITLICTTGKDINNLSANLERKLKFYERGKINFLD